MSEEAGFNAQTERYENLVQAGVFGSTKVVRSALQNAASIASLLLTTEASPSLMPLHAGHNGSGPMNGAGDAASIDTRGARAPQKTDAIRFAHPRTAPGMAAKRHIVELTRP